MARSKTIALTLLASTANAVCAAQTPAGAGALTLNGTLATAGVATLDVPRHLLITTAANDSARTLTITGTNRLGATMTVTTTAPNATTKIVTGYNFKTITAISIDDAAAGAITIGTANSLESAWIPLDWRTAGPETLTVLLSSGASLTWALHATVDDVQAAAFNGETANVITIDNFAGTASLHGTMDSPWRALRIAISNWVSGTATFNLIESAG